MTGTVYTAGKARIVPATGKLYDITHADTDEHSVALPAGYPENTRAMIVYALRSGGTGKFYARSVSGSISAVWVLTTGTSSTGVWVRAADGLFYYKLDVANDDWDVYAVGYVTGAP